MNLYSQRAATAILGLIFSQRAVAQQAEVVIADAGNICPPGYAKITTKAGCKAAMKRLALPNFQEGFPSNSDWPSGCYHDVDGVRFNKDAVGSSNGGATPICAVVDTLFVGDSDVEYWDTDDYPNSDNVGVAGGSCRDLNKIIDAQLQEYKPKRVVIVCGENDLQGGGSVLKTSNIFKAVIGKIIASGARAFYLGTKPEPVVTKTMHDKYLEYDAKIRDYVTALDANDPTSSPPLVMVDVNPAFKQRGNPPNLYATDGLRLSEAGYKLWNAWTNKALSDTLGCVLWMNGACVRSTGPTAPPPPSSTVPPPPLPECKDDPDFHLGKSYQNCAWVGERSIRKNRVCKLKWQGKVISAYCRATCDKCGEDDYNDNAGVLSAVDKGSVF